VLNLGEKGTSSYVPGQREATLKVCSAIAVARNFSGVLGDLTEADLSLVLPAERLKRHEILKTLVRELAKASRTADCGLEFARSAAKAIKPPPMFQDVRVFAESVAPAA
jgi:hypothetical protein